MNLALYCSVAEAAVLAGISEQYVRLLLSQNKIEGEKLGTEWVVLRSAVVGFQRQPGMGRPKKPKKRSKKRPKK